MEPANSFFSNVQARRSIQKFLDKLERLEAVDDFERERNSHIKLILTNICSEPEPWSVNCSINIQWFGDNFLSTLSDEKATANKEKLDEIYSICFRFLLEYYLSIKNDLSREFEKARQFATNNLEKFSGEAKSQIDFALKDMPIAIIKMLINHENIDSVKNFNKTTEKAEIMKREWDKELENKTIEVNQLKENLDKYKAAFNFVGLYQGFDELALDKQKNKKNILSYLTLVGLLILLPILAEMSFIIANFNNIINYRSSLLILVIPTISLIGVLVYCFRILLINFNSVKSQLLQLDLRKTLCRFIQNYVDYSLEIKKKDKDALSRFENVVFSGLVTSDEKLPSTFDGMEQLTALIKSVK